jgi:hypothetical protein
VNYQNRGKIHKNGGSGSCPFRKGWGTREDYRPYKRPIKKIFNRVPYSINTEGPSIRILNKRFVHSFIF